MLEGRSENCFRFAVLVSVRDYLNTNLYDLRICFHPLKIQAICLVVFTLFLFFALFTPQFMIVLFRMVLNRVRRIWIQIALHIIFFFPFIISTTSSNNIILYRLIKISFLVSYIYTYKKLHSYPYNYESKIFESLC